MDKLNISNTSNQNSNLNDTASISAYKTLDIKRDIIYDCSSTLSTIINSTNRNSIEYVYSNILSYKQYSENFLKMLTNELELLNNEDYWDSVLETQNLSINFIETFYKNMSLEKIIKYQNIDDEFIYNHENDLNDKCYSEISRYINKFSLDFIDKYKDKLNWEIVVENRIFDNDYKEFIDRFIDYIRPENMTKRKNNYTTTVNLSSVIEYYINTYLDKYPDMIDQINWFSISWSCNLSEEFIIQYLSLLDWSSPVLQSKTYKSDEINVYKRLIK